jgi:hypothetical protein
MIIDPKVWHDVSNEISRTYHYPDGFEFKVGFPLELNIQVSSMGGHSHRIKTRTQGYYIAPGWKVISWEAPDGGFKF